MKNTLLITKISSERVARLLGMAHARTLDKNERSAELARRYVKIARRMSTHYKIAIPKEIGQRICKKCGNLMIPGVNCSVKVASVHGYLAYVCECGAERHIFYKKKR